MYCNVIILDYSLLNLFPYSYDQDKKKMVSVSINKQDNHSPLFIRQIDRVLLVVVVNLFVQLAVLCGQLVDLTPNSNNNNSLLNHRVECSAVKVSKC